MDFVYIVWAYRHAEIDSHNYLVGCYDDPSMAITFADDEKARRGNYDCIVYKTKLNNPSYEYLKDRIFYKTCEKFYEAGGGNL